VTSVQYGFKEIVRVELWAENGPFQHQKKLVKCRKDSTVWLTEGISPVNVLQI